MNVVLISRRGGAYKEQSLARAGFNVSWFQTPYSFIVRPSNYKDNPPDLVITGASFSDHSFHYKERFIDCDGSGDHVDFLLRELENTKFIVYSMNYPYFAINFGPLGPEAEESGRLVIMNEITSFDGQVIPAATELLARFTGKRPVAIEIGNSPTRVILVKGDFDTPETIAKKTDILSGQGYDVYAVDDWKTFLRVFNVLKGDIQGVVAPHQAMPPDIYSELEYQRIPIAYAAKGNSFVSIIGSMHSQIRKRYGHVSYKAPGKVFALDMPTPS